MGKEITVERQKVEPMSLMKIDPQALMQSAIEKGSGVETLERLVALAKDLRSVQAKEAYDHAVAQFQKDCPPISKSKTARIAARTGGGYNYSYASLEEITRTISPVLGALGLSISYRIKHEPGKVVAICKLTHELGWFEDSGEIAMPVMTGDGTGANDAQKVGISSTYAKRYALLAITGIAPEDDPDASGMDNAKPKVNTKVVATSKPSIAREEPTIAQRTERMLKYFSDLGATEEMVLLLLKLDSTDRIGIEELDIMAQYSKAIAAGSSVESIFAVEAEHEDIAEESPEAPTVKKKKGVSFSEE